MNRILFFLFVMILMVSCTNYSSGERTGIITKFSESGRIFKSYDGELKIAPNAAQSGMIGNYETFEFSIDNDSKIQCETPIDSIFHWARKGIPVTIVYQQTRYLNWWNNRGGTNYFIKMVIPNYQ